MNNYSTKGVSIDNLHGNLEFNLTNDYMFRAVFQTNEVALKGLLCALLQLREDEIQSIEIQNPIELGKAITDKEFRLDIKIMLNDKKIINIEMQVNNLGNWPERSLSYACRMFDNLNRGDNYIKVTPVIQIGILDFTPFKDHPSFFATYKVKDESDGFVYSEDFVIKTLDLTRIDLATKKDKSYNLDEWAKIFKAKTWDELKALSKNNNYMREAAKSMRVMTEAEELRERMIERQEFYAIQKYLEERAARTDKAEEELKESEAKLKESEAKLKESEGKLKESETARDKAEAELKDSEIKLKDSETRLKDSEAKLKESEAELNKVRETTEKSLAEKDKEIEDMKKKIEEMEKLLMSKK